MMNVVWRLLRFSLLATACTSVPPHARVVDASFQWRSTDWASGHLHSVNIFSPNGKDPRQLISRSVPAAGKLLPLGYMITDTPIEGMSGKTGRPASNAFLVSPCYALAVYHGIFGARINRPLQEYPVKIWLGDGALSNGFRYSITAQPIRIHERAGNDRNGLVLMQLEQCAGKRLGWVSLLLSGDQAMVGRTVSMASYSLDLPLTSIAYQPTCSIRARDTISGFLLHDCASMPGSSGGVIFSMISGEVFAVAANWGAATMRRGLLERYTHQDASLAVGFDMLKETPDIINIINDDIAAFKGNNPAKAASGNRT